MYVFLFLLPIFFAQMEVEACIHLKCAESVVQREIVPMIIIVFSNKGGTDKILSVIVDNACANQKVEVEFTVPLFSFVGFRIYVGSPPEMSASTSTGKPLRPLRPKLLRTAYMGAPFCPMGRQRPSIKGDEEIFTLLRNFR